MAVVHVDDGKFGVRTDSEVQRITARLESGLNAIISGTGDPYVGIDMRWVDKNVIAISQAGYIRKLLKRFQMSPDFWRRFQ